MLLAQTAVEATTLLILGPHVTDQAHDKQQLIPTLTAVSPVVPQVTKATGTQKHPEREVEIGAIVKAGGQGGS